MGLEFDAAWDGNPNRADRNPAARPARKHFKLSDNAFVGCRRKNVADCGLQRQIAGVAAGALAGYSCAGTTAILWQGWRRLLPRSRMASSWQKWNDGGQLGASPENIRKAAFCIGQTRFPFWPRREASGLACAAAAAASPFTNSYESDIIHLNGSVQAEPGNGPE